MRAAAALGRPQQVGPDVGTRLEPIISGPMGPSRALGSPGAGEAARPAVGMSRTELSEKAQFSHHCQPTYKCYY